MPFQRLQIVYEGAPKCQVRRKNHKDQIAAQTSSFFFFRNNNNKKNPTTFYSQQCGLSVTHFAAKRQRSALFGPTVAINQHTIKESRSFHSHSPLLPQLLQDAQPLIFASCSQSNCFHLKKNKNSLHFYNESLPPSCQEAPTDQQSGEVEDWGGRGKRRTEATH